MSNYNRDYSSQQRATEAASERAADRAVDRTLYTGRQANVLANNRSASEYSYAQQDKLLDRQWKSDENQKDRAKSSDEFTQNRAQNNFNSAQDRSNQEFSARQLQENNKRSQDYDTFSTGMKALTDGFMADRSNAANKTLAEISQNTAKSEQKSLEERARTQAQAQVAAALYSGRRSYSSY